MPGRRRDETVEARELAIQLVPWVDHSLATMQRLAFGLELLHRVPVGWLVGFAKLRGYDCAETLAAAAALEPCFAAPERAKAALVYPGEAGPDGGLKRYQRLRGDMRNTLQRLAPALRTEFALVV